MLRLTVPALILCMLALAACGGSSSYLPSTPSVHSTTNAAQGSAGRYVVGFAPGVSVAQMQGVIGGLAHAPARVYHAALQGFSGPLTAAEHRALAADPRIAYVEPNIQFTVAKGKPPHPGGGGGGDSPPPEAVPWGVNRIDAELNSENSGDAWNGGSGVSVAVIDTGIDLNHPDLVGNVEDGFNFVRSGKPADDDNGHGTHVAGIIAAVHNTIGVVGVAPKAKVVAVKVLDRRGNGWLDDVVAGVDWVADNSASRGIKVANMSLTAYGTSYALEQAIDGATAAGVTVVAAAGNSYADANYYIPARYNHVICVSALKEGDTFASFSNWGSAVDLIAPGVDVPSLYKNGGYKTLSGTSMAAPHVAGAAALWLDNNIGGFDQVYSALVGGGEPGPGSGWPGDHAGDPVEPLVDAESL